MRFLFYVFLAVVIIWVWPIMFQKDPAEIPTGSSLGGLTGVEQQYYRQVFDYVMEAVRPNTPYNWETASGYGKIYASETFTSKSGATCRSFSESYTIGDTGGTVEGIACKRNGRAGWCRLQRSDALTCAMEPPGGIMEKTMRGTEDVIESGKGVLGKIKGAW